MNTPYAVTVATAVRPVQDADAYARGYADGLRDALRDLLARTTPPADDWPPVCYPPAPAGRFRVVGSND